MTYAERQAVAEILSLPDGPWGAFAGYATAEEYGEAMVVAEAHNEGCKNPRSLNAAVKTPRKTKAKARR